MQIVVKCKSADLLPIDTILEFQGNLKRLTKTNREKLKRSILKYGFIAPIFVWENQGDYYILDGHQRLKTLIHMRQEGYNIPLLPVDYIEAATEKEAHDKLLVITSQYGEFDKYELEEWCNNIEKDTKELLRLTDSELKIDIEEKAEYTEKELKAYEKIHVLISISIKDIEKYNKVIEFCNTIEGIEVEKSSN